MESIVIFLAFERNTYCKRFFWFFRAKENHCLLLRSAKSKCNVQIIPKKSERKQSGKWNLWHHFKISSNSRSPEYLKCSLVCSESVHFAGDFIEKGETKENWLLTQRGLVDYDGPQTSLITWQNETNKVGNDHTTLCHVYHWHSIVWSQAFVKNHFPAIVCGVWTQAHDFNNFSKQISSLHCSAYMYADFRLVWYSLNADFSAEPSSKNKNCNSRRYSHVDIIWKFRRIDLLNVISSDGFQCKDLPTGSLLHWPSQIHQLWLAKDETLFSWFLDNLAMLSQVSVEWTWAVLLVH